MIQAWLPPAAVKKIKFLKKNNISEYIDDLFNIENTLTKNDDLIMFSDPDEIPNPNKIMNLDLKKNMEFSYKNVLFIK